MNARIYVFLFTSTIFLFSTSPHIKNDSTLSDLKKIQALIDYTKHDKPYGAKEFPGGYHSLIIGNEIIQGQRNPLMRLQKVPYNFSDKIVLDIGSNEGGMLFALAGIIKYGIGIDYNSKLINVANKIKSVAHYDNLNFYVFDLDKDPLNLITNFLPQNKIDICFILAVCNWIKNWKKTIDYAQSVSDTLLFEANGNKIFLEQQYNYLTQKYSMIKKLSETCEDDKKGHPRVLYLCSK